ncbi:MAG: TldD/PmbA family protein [Candidatus Methanomethylophilaceae archaeon]
MKDLHDVVMKELKTAGVADGMSILSSAQSAMFRFSRNRMTVSNYLDESSLTIFVRHSQGGSSATVADMRPSAVRQAVQELLRGLPSENEKQERLPRGPFRYPQTTGRPVPLEGEELVDMVQRAVQSAHEEGAEQVAGTLQLSNTMLSLRSTRGVDAECLLPAAELSLRAFKDARSSGHGLSVSGAIADLDPEGVGREAGHLAKASHSIVDCQPGRYEALLHPMVAADMASQVGDMSSAFYVDVGMSFLADRLDEQVCSPAFTLVDDPTRPGTLGHRPFDDEGSPTQENILIQDGVLRSYLHNHATAAKVGLRSSGNAGLVSPRPFNLMVSPGDSDMESMIASMDRGIIVSNVWYLRYQNYRSGDFSAIPRDAMFLVENGEVKGAVRDLRISDNILGMFSRVRSLSQERRWVRWWEVDTPTLSPYMLCDDVNFTRSTM